MWIADPICECVIVVAQLGQRTLAKVLSRFQREKTFARVLLFSSSYSV